MLPLLSDRPEWIRSPVDNSKLILDHTPIATTTFTTAENRNISFEKATIKNFENLNRTIGILNRSRILRKKLHDVKEVIFFNILNSGGGGEFHNMQMVFFDQYENRNGSIYHWLEQYWKENIRYDLFGCCTAFCIHKTAQILARNRLYLHLSLGYGFKSPLRLSE